MVNENRSFITYLLLSIFTCGIYSLFFWYEYAEDMNKMCAGDGRETTGGATLILLWLFTCGIYPLYWFYTVGNRLKVNSERYGVHIDEDGQTILLWSAIGYLIAGVGLYIGAYFLINNANTVAAAYNKRNGTPYTTV